MTPGGGAEPDEPVATAACANDVQGRADRRRRLVHDHAGSDVRGAHVIDRVDYRRCLAAGFDPVIDKQDPVRSAEDASR